MLSLVTTAAMPVVVAVEVALLTGRLDLAVAGAVAIGAPLALGFYLTARYAPRGYLLGVDGLHVERRASDFVVPYHTIRGVDRTKRAFVGLGAGSKGFLGDFTFGRAWRPGLGRYRLCLTNRQNAVWLQTSGGWIAVSPDRADEFVARLSARLSMRSRLS